MKKVVYILLCCLLASLTWLVVECVSPLQRLLNNLAFVSQDGSTLTLGMHHILTSANSAVLEVNSTVASLKSTLSDLNATLNGKHGLKELLRNSDLLTAQLARTSTTLEIASKEEHQKVLETSSAVLQSVKDLDKFVVETQAQLDGNTLPALTTSLTSTTEALNELSGINGLLPAATKLVSNPEWFRISSNIDTMTTYAAVGIQHGSNILGIVEKDLSPEKPTLKQIILSGALNRLPEFLMDWFLKTFTTQKVQVVK